MSVHIEKTLVLLKPDAVQRGIMGKVITRFEDVGLKIIGMKLVQSDKDMAGEHYDEDVAKRRGDHVRNRAMDLLLSGPVLAMVIEGVNAVENVRKMCGTTEPMSAPPGTIRGDFSHVSYGHCDEKEIAIRNIIHASGDKEYAKKEIKIWFTPEEIFDYKAVHEMHTR
ncbi:MAG: nucleoside-diphosphate kinase [bacterium]|nr:nucleoside-diphosphate kinase [bacterium]